MATFLQMQNRVFTVVRDTNKIFVLLTDVKDWLNEAQADLAARLRCLEKQITQATGGAAQITSGALALPADFLGFVDKAALRLGTTDVRFVDETTWWSFSDNTLDVPDDEYIGRIFAGSIEFYPTPANNAAYTLRYVYQPADLVNDADVSPLPDEWHVRMVQYARAHAKYKENEDRQGDRYLSLYEDGLPAIRSPRSVNRPGPISMIPEPNLVDSDSESIHINL